MKTIIIIEAISHILYGLLALNIKIYAELQGNIYGIILLACKNPTDNRIVIAPEIKDTI
ncbi:TPA: hypothetical protein ACIZY6_002060 [Streptococcus agalactiae]